MKKAILLSGGMDSICLAYWKNPELAITIDYGQRASQAEILAAATVADVLNIRHLVIRADLAHLGSGDMSSAGPLPMAPVSEWWPYRNQMLITIAAMKAVGEGVSELMIAALKTDGIHRDGTAEFIGKISDLLQFQEGNLSVTAPAIHLDAIELVQESGINLELLGWAHSCHTSNHACGVCRGCLKHFKTMSIVADCPY